MNERDFVYWLRGFFEIGEKGGLPVDCLTPDQVREIKRHLEMVFTPAEKLYRKKTECAVGIPGTTATEFAGYVPVDELKTTISC